MKLIFLILASILSYQCCAGYPVVEGDIPDDILKENVTSIEYWIRNNDSTALDMHGIFKKIVDKTKDKMKDDFKDKIKDCKDILKILTLSAAREATDILRENGTLIDYWSNASNNTASNDSLSLYMHGFFKKVVDKVKDKVKENLNKVKDKVKNCKDILKVLTFSDFREMSEDILNENETAFEYWFNSSNVTIFNDSSPMDMHGFGKKVVNKVKEGIKTVKDKVKGGFNKIKDKINDFKDKIGSKGGSGGGSRGGYYRDKYDRDYNRDKYDRDYYRKDRGISGGSGISDPNAKWIGLGIGIFMLVGIAVVIIYYKFK